MGLSVREAADEAAAGALWSVMRELRPHLDEHAFVAAVSAQRAEGYRLIGAWRNDVPLAAAGFRIQHMLAHGRLLYVDDLVTAETSRGQGVGRAVFDWLTAEARRLHCAGIQLDSGTWRHAAHAFYFARGMHVSSFHFVLGLDA
ncbi:MAG TPA: GNAT family N-acetyltransferase [Xanthomonadaceae bacterium]|nr:GNAT family N-acetyltransferase [Xanthomonadaceae bacterium]